MCYIEPHWTAFIETPYQQQGAIGSAPSLWAERILQVPFEGLPQNPLNRTQVREICSNMENDVLLGYICVMAWGGQSNRFGYAQQAWANLDLIDQRLTQLRMQVLTHFEAYNLFTGENQIPGLGPAYITKLIYFFSPDPASRQTGFYIMDQWTGKSIDLLIGHWVVRMVGNAVANTNNYRNYQVFCENVDRIAQIMHIPGSQVEEMLFSKGGIHPWPWRQHVRDNWHQPVPFAPI